MDWLKKIIPAVATVAPTIAGLLGGPLASMGVTALESVFGVTPGTTATDPTALTNAVAAMSPDDAVKLAQADSDLKAKLAQAGVDMAKIYEDDTENARARQIAVKDHMPAVLSLLAVGSTIVLVALILTGYAPALTDPNTSATVGVLVGLLVSEAKQAYQYYLGSSLGSAKKDDTIQSLSNQ